MIEYKGYVGRVEFDPDTDLLHGEVIGTRDVITLEGRSVDEIRQAFQDSIEDYLELCRERGEEPDPPYSGELVLRLDPELYRRLSELAGASGKPLDAWITERLQREALAEA